MSNEEFDAWLTSRKIAMSAGLTEDRIQSLSNDELDDEIWTWLADTDALSLGELDPYPRAFFATRLFEWEVGNGSLHQFFYNHPAPDLYTAVVEGYELLALHQQAELPALDQLVGSHDSVRLAFVRSHASRFTHSPS